MLVLLVGCDGEGTTETDTGAEIEAMCAGEGDPLVELGLGAGGLFAPLQDGAQVALDVAPQGGFGVTVQVQTLGLKTDGAATVRLDTEIDGLNSGTFTNENLFLFCRDDGSGTLGSGVAVGFDPAQYTADNLEELDGVVTDLVVTITDERGVVATGRSTVEIALGAR